LNPTPARLSHLPSLPQLRPAFVQQRHEKALMANDIDALNSFFWADPAVTRYGVCDKQLGYEALVEYRKSVPVPDFTRELINVRLTEFFDNTVIAMCEFQRTDTDLHGFQTQTWVKLDEGWKIVSAHVSMV
ncbi:UNVERIFIED_CONTAM: nuclear transport factor 2 family protein, partial [Comamonas sp. A-3]